MLSQCVMHVKLTVTAHSMPNYKIISIFSYTQEVADCSKIYSLNGFKILCLADVVIFIYFRGPYGRVNLQII